MFIDICGLYMVDVDVVFQILMLMSNVPVGDIVSFKKKLAAMLN